MINILSAPPIDESNYLEIDPRDLKGKFEYPGFDAVLDYLWRVNSTLNALNKDGAIPKIQSVNNYYLEAIRWLAGQQQTSNWVSIAPLHPDSNTFASEIDSFITSFLPNLKNALNNSALFVAYYEKVNTSTKRADISDSLAREIDIKKEEALKIIDDETKAKVETITAAAGLENWQKYFQELIEPPKNIESNPKTNELGFYEEFKPNWLKRLKLFISEDPSSYYAQMLHHKLWRNIWLFAFVLFLAGSVLLEVLMNWNIQDNLAEIISIKVGIVALFGTLFVSSNKNYRIYANLYDQTKFRSVVSKTIQGILLDDSRIAPEQKGILLTVAAQTLFEMKTSGHLTKKDTGSPVNDLLVSLIGRQQ